MSIDPRLAERRKTVAEDNAHRNIWRLLQFLAVLLSLGALVWLAFSPWLSVSQVRVAGVVASDAHSTLASHRVVAGTPMILIRGGGVVEALEADPWVREASVELDWPDEVVVRVTERVPVIWVETAEGWTWRATDGVAVPGPDAPEPDSPTLRVGTLDDRALDETQLVQGAAEFVAALPDELATGMTLTYDSGELWTTLGDFEVRLGRPVDMGEKALSLTALLDEELPPGATLVLIAPTHPAVESDEEVADPAEGSDTEERGEEDPDDEGP